MEFTNEDPLPLDRFCFVLLRSEHIQELHSSLPWDRPVHKLFALSTSSLLSHNTAEPWLG